MRRISKKQMIELSNSKRVNDLFNEFYKFKILVDFKNIYYKKENKTSYIEISNLVFDEDEYQSFRETVSIKDKLNFVNIFLHTISNYAFYFEMMDYMIENPQEFHFSEKDVIRTVQSELIKFLYSFQHTLVYS